MVEFAAPPDCPNCGKPCWRQGHMAEMHLPNEKSGAVMAVCMWCYTGWMVERPEGRVVLRPLTDQEREEAQPVLQPLARVMTIKQAMAKAFGGEPWDYDCIQRPDKTN